LIAAGRSLGLLAHGEEANTNRDKDKDQCHTNQGNTYSGGKGLVIESAVASGSDGTEQTHEQTRAATQHNGGDGGDQASILVIHYYSSVIWFNSV
jgi:hypothetical protein